MEQCERSQPLSADGFALPVAWIMHAEEDAVSVSTFQSDMCGMRSSSRWQLSSCWHRAGATLGQAWLRLLLPSACNLWAASSCAAKPSTSNESFRPSKRRILERAGPVEAGGFDTSNISMSETYSVRFCPAQLAV